MTDRFKLYIISTNRPLDDIYNMLLGKALSKKDIGPLREAFVREKVTGVYKKINKKFVLTTEDVYSGMKSSGFCDESNTDLYMVEYDIRDGDKAPSDSVMHYYFPPSEITIEEVGKKLEFLSKMGLFNDSEYSVQKGLVEFNNSVSENVRIIVKIIIDTANCRVSWCKIKAFNKIEKHFHEVKPSIIKNDLSGEHITKNVSFADAPLNVKAKSVRIV